MNKLLVTTALVLVTATSASAWTDANTLVTELEKVYSGVDGTTQFNNLGKGELGSFINDVNAGVTHITLTVDANNEITPALIEGKTLAELENSAGNLVNRINYDLFHDATPQDANDTVTGTYDSATDYTITATTTDSLIDHTVGGDLTADSKLGLVGFKVNTIVTNVDTINSGLVNAPGTTPEEVTAAAAANNAFIAAYNGKLSETHFGVNVGDFLGDITEVNSSIAAAGGSNFFGNTAGFADTVDSGTLSAFSIPGFDFITETDNVTLTGGLTDGTDTYSSLSNWAAGIKVTP